jgi:hypothetical protein
MRLPARILGAFLAVLIVAGIGSALGALFARGRVAGKNTPADDEFDLVAIYEPMNVASTATALRRVRVTTWYGGGTVDLRGAMLDRTGARLTMRALFGGIRLVVPEAWRVQLSGTGVFGGFGDGRTVGELGPGAPMLTIDGWAVFGGVGVVADAPELRAGEASTEPTGMSGGVPELA